MKFFIQVMGVFILIIVISGCGVTVKEGNEPVKGDPEKIDVAGDIGEKENVKTENTTYPMPILNGWKEIEIKNDKIGSNKRDIWHGEFSFEGDVEDQFEQYKVALTEMGFEIEVTEDIENAKTIKISKEIDGMQYMGNVSMRPRWVKSSIEHF